MIAHEIGYRVRICQALEGMAALAAAEGKAERALRLAGAAAGLRDISRQAVPPPERAWLERALTLQQAVDYALHDSAADEAVAP